MVMLSEALLKQEIGMMSEGQVVPAGRAREPDLTQSSQHRSSGSDKRQLLAALSKVCALQKQYGKSAADLETLVEGFLWVLSDYPMPAILHALAQYVKRHSDIPAPADLVNLIDPPKPEWKPDWPVYITLKKKIQRDGYYAYGTEREFLKMCDEYAMKRAMDSAEPASEDEKTARLIATGEKTFALEGPNE